ncbi:hypothetical protein [Actinomadura nitritigenes]|uniref:hypothetical protein n=1 Tax=Actinomadura nitritigenes TaxID=134602 RepID=UPI003D91CD83
MTTPTAPEDRAQAVADAWADHPGRNTEGCLTITVPGRGETTIGDIQAGAVDGIACVDVWTGPADGPPQFRIVNPPLLVPDGQGPLYLPGPGDTTSRYRLDPVAAVADAINLGGR